MGTGSVNPALNVFETPNMSTVFINPYRFASGSLVLQDSLETGDNADRALGNGVACAGTSFQTTSAYTCARFEFLMSKTGSPTGNMTGYIYTSDPFGSNNPPDDRDVVATATLDVSTISATKDWYGFDFTGATAFTDATNYQLVVYYDAGSSGNVINVRYDTFVSGGTVSFHWRGTGPPGSSNDDIFWGGHDLNGSGMFKTFS